MLHQYLDELTRLTRMADSLLDAAGITAQSPQFAGHPDVGTLGAYVLDDEDTSSDHFLVTAGPLAGGIFFLSHDDCSHPRKVRSMLGQHPIH